MAAGHEDVNLPRSTWHRAETFLDGLVPWLQNEGVSNAWVKQKEPGGHLVGYWVYASLDATRPAKSTVVFGVTRFAAVNANIHAWARGKSDFLPTAVKLLRSYLAAWENQGGVEQDWRVVGMTHRLCPQTGARVYHCNEDAQLSFVADAGSIASRCGHWREYQDAEGRRWWCNETRLAMFFTESAA